MRQKRFQMGLRDPNIPRCHEHGMPLPCQLCELNCWPLRDLQAVTDFVGRPVNNPDGYIPEVPSILLSEVIRSIGRRWVEVETVKLTTFRPIYDVAGRLRKECKIGVIDANRLEKASRLVAQGKVGHDDPVINLYMQTIIEDQSTW